LPVFVAVFFVFVISIKHVDNCCDVYIDCLMTGAKSAAGWYDCWLLCSWCHHCVCDHTDLLDYRRLCQHRLGGSELRGNVIITAL